MSKLFEKILSRIPLECKIKTYLTMEDYDNWDNGEYKGDKERIKKMTEDLLDIIKKHKEVYKGPEEI
jgi:hypothetical protein